MKILKSWDCEYEFELKYHLGLYCQAIFCLIFKVRTFIIDIVPSWELGVIWRGCKCQQCSHPLIKEMEYSLSTNTAGRYPQPPRYGGRLTGNCFSFVRQNLYFSLNTDKFLWRFFLGRKNNYFVTVDHITSSTSTTPVLVLWWKWSTQFQMSNPAFFND